MLAVIVPYFNPVGYQRRLKNCLAVIDEYKRLGANLFVPELSLTDRFEIPDANWQLNSSSCLFHKENLINFAVRQLPPKYDKILWSDADMLPFKDNWFDLVEKTLNEFEIVQAFKRLCHNNFNDELSVKNKNSKRMPHLRSMVSGGERHMIGFSWAARREIFDHGLYAHAITGSGDVLFVNAVLEPIEAWQQIVNPEAQGFYLKWCNRIGRRKVGYVESDLLHLWHGNLGLRHYQHRHKILRVNHYDPERDIDFNRDGMMEINNPKLQEDVWGYFRNRKEDLENPVAFT